MEVLLQGFRSTHHTSKGSNVRRTGFTLIELILVMLIVAVIMGIVAPSLRNFLYGRKTANAANMILALAHNGRSKAIMEGRTYRLNVDPNSGTYWLDAQDGADFRELGTSSGQHFKLPEDTKASWEFPDSSAVNNTTGNAGGMKGGTFSLGGNGLGATFGSGQAGPSQTPAINTGQTDQSVRFYSDGRCEGGTLILTGSKGERMELGSPSESEQWKVLTNAGTN